MGQSLQALSKQERLEQWSGKIAACRGSGMTVRAWCQERGISEKTYYYWQRRLFQELTRNTGAGPRVCGYNASQRRRLWPNRRKGPYLRFGD